VKRATTENGQKKNTSYNRKQHGDAHDDDSQIFANSERINSKQNAPSNTTHHFHSNLIPISEQFLKAFSTCIQSILLQVPFQVAIVVHMRKEEEYRKNFFALCSMHI
jgi:hypothetical protein